MRLALHYSCLGLLVFYPVTVKAQLLTGYASSPSPAAPPAQISDPAPILTQTPSKAAPARPSKVKPDDAVKSSHNAFQPFMTGGGPREDGAAAADQTGDNAPVDLQANMMSHNEQTQVVTASGDVMIVQAGRILRADEVRYNVGTDTVQANGNVVLNEENGDIHVSDEVVYQNELQNGTVQNLRSFLNDGSRFTAVDGERQGGTKTIMRSAMYTPCEPCKANPDKPPVWDLRAAEVTHDEEENRISYKHARFEAFGVPIAYTPYFSHPDGSINQKSGFLTPSGGYKSSLGLFANEEYYWAIAPDQDLTAGVMLMSKEDPLYSAEYRKRWENASMELSGGVTTTSRTDQINGAAVEQSDETRGHVLARGRWDMNDKWRSGVNVNWTSDDQYMRQFDFVNEDVLENEVYAERFSGRDYASARLISYQDIRVRENQVDQPSILPEVVASFKGEPGAVPLVKGQWTVNTSMLGLIRDDGGQDMQRFGLGLGWDRRLVSRYGLVTDVTARARGDIYHIQDRPLSAGGEEEETESRLFPQMQVKTSYPMARQFEKMQAKFEPILSVTAAPNVSYSDDIPNEDSNDVQVDASNIFEMSRFPGLDRLEDQSRVTYGIRGGLFGYDGSSVDAFIGQSYRMSEDDNPFPQGSGLDDQGSDIVGQISGIYGSKYYADYRFQLSNESMASQRHEIEANADWNRFALNARYLYAKGLEGTDIDESREQAQLEGAFYANENWRVRLGAIQDLGETPGLRKAYGGFDYFGQCLFVSLTGEKNYTSDTSGESDTEVLFRIGLKNLSDFQASGYRRSVAGTP